MDRQVPARGRARRALIWGASAIAVVLVVLSPAFGRAHPEGNYRPDLPPDALRTGCYPLPEGVHLDFELQVRSDEDLTADARRRLVVQYDRIDAAQAARKVTDAFQAAGYAESSDPAQPGTLRFTKARAAEVEATVTPLPDVGPDDLVRGTIELLLPQVALASNSLDCANRFSTKRFAAWRAAR